LGGGDENKGTRSGMHRGEAERNKAIDILYAWGGGRVYEKGRQEGGQRECYKSLKVTKNIRMGM
jgi:hypothetical protein